MTYHDNLLAHLRQLTPREIARMAGALAPTAEPAATWLYRIQLVAADFADSNRGAAPPLSAEHANEVFAKIKETTETLTPHQLWAAFADLGAYSEASTTSHLANAHSLDNIARYTLNDIGTRFIPQLINYLHSRINMSRIIFDDLTTPDDGT